MMTLSRAVVVGLALVWIGCDTGLPDDEVRGLTAELDRAVGRAEVLDTQRRERLAPLMEASAAPETTRCERSVLLMRSGLAPSAFFRLDGENGNLRISNDVQGEGLRLAEARRRAAVIRDRLEGRGVPYGPEEVASVRSQIAEIEDPARWYRHEIHLVTVQVQEPRLVSPGQFQAGFRRSRIAVWDHASGAASCAGEIVTRSDAEENVLAGNADMQARGLEVNLAVRHRDEALAALGLQ